MISKKQKGDEKMWISKRKWKALEKRVADLEREVQGQPEKIIWTMQNQLYNQMAKSHLPRRQKSETQSGEQV